jgi:carbamoyltransferase
VAVKNKINSSLTKHPYMTELILAVHAIAHDPSAAIFENGELIALGEEERFTRKKHAPDEFPVESTRYCLDECSVSLSEIDKIVYGWDCTKYPLKMAKKFLDLSFEYNKNRTTIEWEKKQLRSRDPNVVEKQILAELQVLSDDIPPIEFVNHHKSHAVSAFYYSGFSSAAVLTADGYGEELTTTGWRATEDEFERVFSIEFPHSIGLFFETITTFLGFRANNGEGKVMGLAPYGEPTPDIRDVLTDILMINSGGFCVDPTYIYYGDHTYHDRFTDKLVDELGQPREHDEEITHFHKNLAYEAQKLLQKALLSCAERLLEETGMNRLCLAGGVVLNCKANMRLREQLDIKDLFIQPVAGDNGIPLGAGLVASEIDTYSSSARMQNPYYGWQATDEQVTRAINSSEVELIARGRDDVRKHIADELANGGIVARYNGRMECGPRALGNRSILADPSNDKNLIAVNEVKQREKWRPFAPTILEEHAADLLVGDKFDPFMIQTYDVIESELTEIEATVHVDNTTRPQVLAKSDNKTYWKLIKEFYERTGVPAVLNTSFNLSGDPIVRTPQEAIETFLSSAIDYLQVEEHLLSK